MISRLLPLIAALLLSACNTQSVDWPEPSPALWRVTSPDGHTGYLFGTVHALPDGLAWRTPALEAALAEAGELVMEIGPADRPDPAAFERLAHSLGLPPLVDRVPPADRDALTALLAGREDAFAEVETWAAAIMLASENGSEVANGVEPALVEVVGRVQALEDRQSQLELFDRLPQADQVALLLDTVRSAQTADEQNAVRAWLTGDTEELDRLARTGLLATAGLREALLSSRNRNWLPTIEGAIASGARPMIAVGAVHLAGADGLPAMLAARGYTVTRVQ